VLVAEELFASGCRLLVSITSAGQITPVATPPYFVIIERALRDEGTSYHYAAPSEYSEADPRYTFPLGGQIVGIIGCAVGAPFAVLVAEELFASGCRLKI